MTGTYDAIVVGGGIAGLTAAAYLTRAGKSVLLCEKHEKCGGLINTFVREGFHYDGGIRALENSGVLMPMLKQLGIELDLLPNLISIGVEDKVIRIESDRSLVDYRDLLVELYPENTGEIDQIIQQIGLIMHYMDVQYGINNPIFLDIKENSEYMLKVIVPWLFKYSATAPKLARLSEPTLDFLSKYSSNQALLDIIAQHFFTKTPAFFALSYLKLFLEYQYPRGGTGTFINRMVDLITAQGGVICNRTDIVEVDAQNRLIRDAHGNQYKYKRLIWAADQQTLYRVQAVDKVRDPNEARKISERKQLIAGKSGNDSVFSLFLGVDIDKQYFADKCTAHFFYTADRSGQTSAGPIPYGAEREKIEEWLKNFLQLTTYEISIPVLRDETLAPQGKTGLIISFLFDYKITSFIEEQGWYADFKEIAEQAVIRVLDASIFPGLAPAILHRFSSSPVTMQKWTGNHEGAITGWSFTNDPVPAESRIPKIMNSIKTPIQGVYQAGQWTYSPSGLPVSLLTGKIAADQVLKDLKKGL